MSAEMKVTIRELCSLPPDCIPNAITSDGHVIAFCPEPDGHLRFVWDGVAGEPFDGLLELRDKTSAVFSSEDGAHVAYVGIRGAKQFVGRDGIEEQAFDAISRSVPPTFGGGGRHLAYGAHVAGGEFRLILDGAPVGTHNIAPIAAVFSTNGERFAYMEVRGDSRSDPECRIILDGQAGDWFAGTRNAPGAMQFSPDGRRFAYYAIDGELHARWFVDGVPQRLFNEVPSLSLARLRGIGVLEPPMPARFSPDSQRFSYFADVVEKGVAIVEDDVPGPLFKGVGVPVFSPDSRHLAYLAQTYENQTLLVHDDTTSSAWRATDSGVPVFSPDSQRVAVTLQRGTRGFLRRRRLYTVAVDGHLFPDEPGDDASFTPTFSPDGATVAWWLRRDTDSLLVINGVVQEAAVIESGIRFDQLGRIVYAGWSDTSQTIVVDDRCGPPADAVLPLATSAEIFSHAPLLNAPVPFRVSPDGAHVAWAGLFGDEMRPIFDDEVGPPFDMISDCFFSDDGVAGWYAQRGEVVFRVARLSADSSGIAAV